MRFLFFLTLSAFLLYSCKKKQESYVPLKNKSSVHQALVKEVIQASTYTFLFVNENGIDYWVAANKSESVVDDVVYFKNALKMVDFKSKELDREFDEIFFVQNISDSPQKLNVKKDQHQHKEKVNSSVENDKVEPAPGGLTIGELFENKIDYDHKKVLIRGKVVKINKNIMDRNWIHLKDGTNFQGKSDLTFTSSIEVDVGDVVVLEGTVSLDKEFGAGYVYPLIVEAAILK